MDEARAKYGCTICDVPAQSPHLEVVLTRDGEMLTLDATATHGMLVYYDL